MGVVRDGIVKKGKGILLGEMGFTKGGGNINWFPGHMASATKAIRNRLKLSDLVIEVRDARIPLSSANQDLQPMLARKRRVIALNKKDLANPNIMPKWIKYFNSYKQDCLPINAHSQSCVQKLLDLVEFKLKELISREPTLLVMVVGVPNVGEVEASYCGSIAWSYSRYCRIQGGENVLKYSDWKGSLLLTITFGPICRNVIVVWN